MVKVIMRARGIMRVGVIMRMMIKARMVRVNMKARVSVQPCMSTMSTTTHAPQEGFSTATVTLTDWLDRYRVRVRVRVGIRVRISGAKCRG